MTSRMDIQLSPSAGLQLDRFCRQYFQLETDPDFPDESYLRDDAFQQSLESKLFQNAIEHAPPQRYQLRILKLLVKKIEQSIQDWDEEGISDGLMNHLSFLFSSSVPTEATSAQQKSCVTYTLSSLDSGDGHTPSISLLESRSLLAAAGTTGLRTWEAALHLGQYLCLNSRSLVQGRSILELGAGTGYISILCAKHLRASRVMATDGSEDVVSSLPDNFNLNGLQAGSLIHAKEFKWGPISASGEHSEWDPNKQIDLVVGADVTYDETAITALVSTFEDIFRLYPSVKIVIAATMRNPKTYGFFREACQGRGYNFEEVDFHIKLEKLQMGPFYPDQVPIQICLITKPVRVRNPKDTEAGTYCPRLRASLERI